MKIAILSNKEKFEVDKNAKVGDLMWTTNGIEIRIIALEMKEKCKPCKGLGEFWIGDGSGNTSKCNYCNGSGEKE